MTLELNRIYCGDCLDLLKEIPEASVDMVIVDLPQGITRNKWDCVIPYDKMWEHIRAVSRSKAPTIVFGNGMFTAELMLSNNMSWRYNLVWDKGNRATGFLNARKMPLRSHEDILVFYDEQPIYNPQKTHGNKNHSRGKEKDPTNNNYGHFKFTPSSSENDGMKFPKSVLKFDTVPPSSKIHPTEKPVALLEYLIKTYSNPSSTVIDFCIGSGATAEAAIRTGRRFIGIEKEPAYVEIALKRIGALR